MLAGQSEPTRVKFAYTDKIFIKRGGDACIQSKNLNQIRLNSLTEKNMWSTGKEEVNSLVKEYGMVIVDECHHVSAFSFEQILKTVNAKYVYGLTATPTRQDGHHPIIYMHCGKIRYRVDAKAQAVARPFEHYVIPRFTKFQRPMHQDEDKWMITDIYSDIQNNEIRNEFIIQDVIYAVEHGRNPIILSERTDHVKYLAERLTPHIKNVIALTGGGTQKQSRETLVTGYIDALNAISH